MTEQVTRLEGEVGDDLHYHARFGMPLLHATVPPLAAQFGRAIIMPNRAKGGHLIEVKEVLAYRRQILAAVPRNDFPFEPLMTVSLTGAMTDEKLKSALDCEHVTAVKFYAGHTTNATGVSDVADYFRAFRMIERSGKPLLIHGETTGGDVYDGEKNFYAKSPHSPAERIRRIFPGLKMVAEHITTIEAVAFVKRHRRFTAATITAHHLLINRTHMLGHFMRPDYYCKPIAQREEDRQALLDAATSGDPRFFAGTDSAPHPSVGQPMKSKYTSHCCAGCFTALTATELYATAFGSAGKLARLLDFLSLYGREFYGLPPNKGRIRIERAEPWQPPSRVRFGRVQVTPFCLDTPLTWKATRLS